MTISLKSQSTLQNIIIQSSANVKILRLFEDGLKLRLLRLRFFGGVLELLLLLLLRTDIQYWHWLTYCTTYWLTDWLTEYWLLMVADWLHILWFVRGVLEEIKIQLMIIYSLFIGSSIESVDVFDFDHNKNLHKNYWQKHNLDQSDRLYCGCVFFQRDL